MTKIAAVCEGQWKEKGGGWEEREKVFFSFLRFLPSSSQGAHQIGLLSSPVLPAVAAQVKPQTVSLRENNSYSFLVSCNSIPYRIKVESSYLQRGDLEPTQKIWFKCWSHGGRLHLNFTNSRSGFKSCQHFVSLDKKLHTTLFVSLHPGFDKQVPVTYC